MIDLKSDLVNLPTDAMWTAMRAAEPDWIIDRLNPQVNRLEAMAAEWMGKEAALFIMTGRMAALVALMTLAERGSQILLEEESHILWSQEWGLAYICGLFARPLKGAAGVMDPSDVERAILDNRFKHRPKTSLLCLENTHNMAGGTVMTVAQTDALCEVAHRHGAKVYLDGARIFHAASALGAAPAELTRSVDAVSFNLTKGLSAPAGAMLCGSKEDMAHAYENLARLGGHAFHKAGILAAAGIVALEQMVERLADDQRRAQAFARGIAAIPGVRVDLSGVQTNIVMADVSETGRTADEFLAAIERAGLRGHRFTESIARFTFHRGVGDAEVEQAIEIVRDVAASAPSRAQTGDGGK